MIFDGLSNSELQWLLGTMRLPGGPGYEQELRRELGPIAYPGLVSGPNSDVNSSDARASTAGTAPAGGWLRRLRHWLSTGGGSTR